MINKNLKKILTKSKAKLLSEYLINRMMDDNTEVDYDWQLSSGKMISGEINTTFKMDSKKGDILEEIKNTFSNIEDFDEEDNKIIADFLNNVKKLLEKSNFSKLRDTIRKKVLSGTQSEIFPLEQIEVVNIEMGGKPDIDYVIVVNKMSPKTELEIQKESHNKSVSQDLMEIHSETREDLHTIISRKKEEENPIYKYVTGAYKKQYWFECHIELFVDYSLGEMPEELKNNYSNN